MFYIYKKAQIASDEFATLMDKSPTETCLEEMLPKCEGK